MKFTLGKIALLAFAIATSIMSSCSKPSELNMPTIFSDNMVLQQKSNTAFWGTASPGAKVSISANWGATESINANSEGNWRINVPTIEAGGPYSIEVSVKGKTISLNNVLLGEVWLASGQSNMEMPLMGWPPIDTILYSDESIAQANFPDIRMFTVTRTASATPTNDVDGNWQICTPETSGNFSATAFFFARKLHQELNIPVGIIHSSWGGTPAEAWISGSMLSIDTDFTEIISNIKKSIPEEEVYKAWLQSNKSIDISMGQNNEDPIIGMEVFDEFFTKENLDFSNWPKINLPAYIEQTGIGDFDGVIWFIKSIEIPASWENQELTLNLGPIDDRDVTYFNGTRVGATEGEGFWQIERSYTIAANLVKAGKATIAIRMTDTQGGGGIYGKPELLNIHKTSNDNEKISIAGTWNYKVVAEIIGSKMYLFNPETSAYDSRPDRSMVISSHTPSALYNGMIDALAPYTIKGAIWYQGETNVGRANQYMRLKSMLITDWRNKFENDEMAFYYVQLAPYNYNDVDGTSSANLREAQRRMTAIANTGLAVTLDIGDVDNIHPANKFDVGERLARIALANNYNSNILYSGPAYSNFEISDDKAIVYFNSIGEGLKLLADVPNQFEIAGTDGNYYPATATIADNTVTLQSAKVKNPANVRYAYKNGSQASLFNSEGLPAPSFTTESEINN